MSSFRRRLRNHLAWHDRAAARRHTALAICVALLAGLAFTPVAAIAQAQAAAVPDAASPGVALRELSRNLDRVLNGELAEDEAVQDYFDVKMVDVLAVSERVSELAREIAASEAWIGELRASLTALHADFAADPSPPAPQVIAPGEAAEEAVAGPLSPSDAAGAVDSVSEAEVLRDGEERRRLEAERRDREATAHAEWLERASARRRGQDEIEAQIVSEALRLAVATKRLDYLRALDERFKLMTDASRRIFSSLGEPRGALRTRAALLAELASAMHEASKRFEELSQLCAAGALVGFVSEQRLLADDLAAGATSQANLAIRFNSLSARLLELADALEVEGRGVRRVLARSASTAASELAIDDLFLSHLKTQRRLRSGMSDVLTASSADTLERLRLDTEALAANPRLIATSSDGGELLEAGLRYRSHTEALLTAETASARAWELAFENEVVTVLSEQASDAARTAAYRFSGEIIDDVTSEIELAWTRVVEGARALQMELPSLAALATTTVGRTYLMRAAAALLIIGACVFLSRKTPRITVALVKFLARIPALRPRVGLLVRSSGLVHSVLPVLVALLGVWLMLFVAREGGPAGPILQAVVVPYLLYVLGRQVLIGATKRITPARPALLEVAPDRLAKLQRTYATLGIVVTLAYILDGVARIAIGGGRVVDLLDGVVILWVGVWGVGETHRWRADLARSWAALVPEEDPPRRERRLANWMEGARLGFVLSPVVLMRVLLTPPIVFLASLATETDVVLSLRARLLRRRSLQADTRAEKQAIVLPEEYLREFPMYPILGEDDSMLVPREAVLQQIVEQWKRWQETRTDGSLVLIGEKGAGKTTLAAQLVRRVEGTQPIQHTLKGKPTTRGELVRVLADLFGATDVTELDELTAWICAGEDRLVLLDEGHNVFLRHVDGFGAYDALVELVNATSSKVFWVIVFNSFTWRFLSESRGQSHYFRRLVHLPKWTPEEIEKLIRLRNRKTKFDLRFDEVLLSDTKAGSDNLALVEEAEGYFRLLWESSGGNPRLATRLWLSSLRPISENLMSVGLFPEPNADALAGLDADLIFSLAAICQHENLSTHELARVLNESEGFARFATQYLSELEFLEAKDDSGDRFSLAPKHYRAVIRLLRSRHLLFD